MADGGRVPEANGGRERASGVAYDEVGADYFAARGLRRYAGVVSLWALGVGAVISGDFFGWNFGLAAGGFGGLLVATLVITALYAGLCFSIAEMTAALPHTGRRLLVRALGDGSVGRLRHRARREHGVHPHAAR
jgi:ethanolamine permease